MNFIEQNIMTIVAALIALLVVIVALMIWRGVSTRVRGRRGQRIGISEYHELDKMRRLVLVRRDNVEHLIMIGGPQDVVIEAGIGLPAQVQPYITQAAPVEGDASSAIPLRPAPRPAVFGDRRPPPLRTADPPLTPSRGRESET